MPESTSKYKKEYDKQVVKLCLLGATDKEIGNFFNVTEQTINNWKNDHPSFFESIKEGKITANSKVAHSLYKRAIGYEHKEDKIFQYEGTPIIVPTTKHYAPDTGACMAFLKNRTRDQENNWTDKQDVELSGSVGFSEALSKARERAGQ